MIFSLSFVSSSSFLSWSWLAEEAAVDRLPDSFCDESFVRVLEVKVGFVGGCVLSSVDRLLVVDEFSACELLFIWRVGYLSLL